MNKIKISYCKINLRQQIIDYNKNFIDFFDLYNNSIKEHVFSKLSNRLKLKQYAQFKSLKPGDEKSILLFKNYMPSNCNVSSCIIIYAIVRRVTDGYIIKFVNWLNWIANINKSLESNYNTINNLDSLVISPKIHSLSEIYWFKALLPLLMHIPQYFISLVSARVFFDIMRIFNNKKGENIYSKDYNRDIISRIKNKVRKNTGLECVEIHTLLKDNSLIDLKYKDQLLIKETVLNEDILIYPQRDKLLEFIISNLQIGEEKSETLISFKTTNSLIKIPEPHISRF